MMLYIRLGRLCALYFEWNKVFTLNPLLKVHDYKGEKILDIPYCRLVLTPKRVLNKRHGQQSDEEINEHTQYNTAGNIDRKENESGRSNRDFSCAVE